MGAGVTGSGPLPGRSADEALRVVAGELGTAPHLPLLPLLPERGPGSDPVGRTMGMLSAVSDAFAVETTPTGWRLSSGNTREVRRARSWLAEDLDAAEEQLDGREGHLLLPACGPLTLAASLELPGGHRALRDHGAVRDLAQALGEALAVHVGEVRRRLPRADPVPRLDEPLLVRVLTGRIATPSGLDTYRSVAEQTAGELLATALGASGSEVRAVRCEGATPPLGVMAASGAGWLSVDLDALDLRRDGDAVGRHIDAGGCVLLGVPVGDAPAVSEVAATVERVTRWWSDLGFDPEALPASVGLLPSGSAPSAQPARQFEVLRAASARLREVQEVGDG